MKFFVNPYRTPKEKLESLQFNILFHSMCYYTFNDNFISDMQYDKTCKQYLECAKENKKVLKETKYYYVFKDFDGNTGFDLVPRLKEEHREKVRRRVKHCLWLRSKEK